MSLIEYVWHKTYGRNRITRKCHEDKLLFYDVNHDGLIAKLKYLGHTANLYCREKRVIFPEYKEQYTKNNHKQQILENDIISFDVFDTLLLRPVCRPTDMFYFLEHSNGIPNFRDIRIKAEQYARNHTNKEYGEINIYDIYQEIHERCDLDVENGVGQELKLENDLCFANPYVFELYKYAVENKKEIIATSDMYIMAEDLLQLLKQKGYEHISKVYVSCDEGVSKHTGLLPQKVKGQYSQKKILHIGDNKHSDYKVWKKYANDVILVNNVNHSGMQNRLYTTTTIQGSVYAGIVNAHLYNGINNECKNPYFEYGYVYGGILTLGFCRWLQEVVKKEMVEKTLFLARDCKIIKEIYDEEYPEEETSYFLTSRIALLPILCKFSFDTFIDEAFKLRLLSERMTVRQALMDLDLVSVVGMFSDYEADKCIKHADWESFKVKVYSVKSEIQNIYSEKYYALRNYVLEQIDGRKKIALVDLGWRGSSILYLKYMIEKEFPETTVIGAMFGTADCSLARMRSCDCTIYSYLFSPEDYVYSEINGNSIVNAKERLFLEYMYTDSIHSVIGYSLADDGHVTVIYEDKNIVHNNAMVIDMHKGIHAFVRDYKERIAPVATCVSLDKEIAYMPTYKLLQNKKALKKMFCAFQEKKSTVHGYISN